MKSRVFEISYGFLASSLLAILLVRCSTPISLTPAVMPDPRFSGYRILYLTQAEAASGFLTPQSMVTSIGAQPVSRWADAVAAHENGDLDALMIHGSSFDQISADEIANIYDHGVVLVFFNVYSRLIGQMLGDSTIFQNSWMDGTAEPMPGNFYLQGERNRPHPE
ncbi:MAG: hypothetical protein ACRDFQ_05820 [Anaerolineales bacterium]